MSKHGTHHNDKAQKIYLNFTFDFSLALPLKKTMLCETFEFLENQDDFYCSFPFVNIYRPIFHNEHILSPLLLVNSGRRTYSNLKISSSYYLTLKMLFTSAVKYAGMDMAHKIFIMIASQVVSRKCYCVLYKIIDYRRVTKF